MFCCFLDGRAAIFLVEVAETRNNVRLVALPIGILFSSELLTFDELVSATALFVPVFNGFVVLGLVDVLNPVGLSALVLA